MVKRKHVGLTSDKSREKLVELEKQNGVKLVAQEM